jgi:hypothetical protein
MIRSAFLWLATTPVGHYMNESTFGFAGVEAVHLLGLAVLGGVVTLLSLAVLRIALVNQPLAITARGLRPIFLSALGVMLATGVLLVASKPLRYYLSEAFLVKMALLALGVAVYLWLDRQASASSDAAPRAATRILAFGLLLTWLGVGLAGRFIGLL